MSLWRASRRRAAEQKINDQRLDEETSSAHEREREVKERMAAEAAVRAAKEAEEDIKERSAANDSAPLARVCASMRTKGIGRSTISTTWGRDSAARPSAAFVTVTTKLMKQG